MQTRHDPDLDRLRRRFLLAALAGDAHGARAVVEAAVDAGLEADRVVLSIVRPALQEVGLRWANAELGVADEHVATATAAVALEALAERLPSRPSAGRVAVVACVEGELHALGARTIGDALERAGWTVLQCGASTPAPDLAELVAERGASLVALSVARRATLPAADATARFLRRLEAPPVVVVGGLGCQRPEDCPSADVVHVGPDFRPVVERLSAS